MPGHKRNIKFGIPSSNIDITEISGFDNLHSTTGIIKNLQESLATLYGYKKLHAIATSRYTTLVLLTGLKLNISSLNTIMNSAVINKLHKQRLTKPSRKRRMPAPLL